MDILERIRADYARFPNDQSYDLYAEDVYFQDPLNQFRGVERYRRMISFMGSWFQQIDLQLHSIEYTNASCLKTRWTLSWVAPVPWQPSMSIPGWSELKINTDGKICSHIDYWDCSRWSVLRQLFG